MNVPFALAPGQRREANIGVNVPAPEPDSGLIANVNMKSLDLDAWNRAIAALIPPTEAAGEQQRRIQQ